MGKVSIITVNQQKILNLFKNEPFLTSHFYFTGGTALSLYYLKHRKSEDLDFFSETSFDVNSVSDIIASWSKKQKFSFSLQQIENLNAFLLSFPNKTMLKVDFAHYPHKRVKRSTVIDGIQVDSLTDIAINKLNSVIQRMEVKDFVDLYFLLRKEFTIWDLIRGVEVKFGYDVEPFLIARDFMKIEHFDFLPKMLVPLKLTELKKFFMQKAKDLAKTVVE